MERNSDQIFDELLVIKCQDQDQKAYALLWKRWQPRILKWSFDFINDADVAKEIAQESWVSIHKGINKLRDPSLFRFWAYKIVQRRSADWIRKEQRKRNSIEEVRHEVVASEEDSSDVVDPVDRMLAAIKDLPEEHQRILRLFYLEKVPVRLLSTMLGLPEGTVKSRLYYAREQLKKKLKKQKS
ncbi:MAG: sigma-70 family RNA polymerase sigma factor [Roseivirga sp.]